MLLPYVIIAGLMALMFSIVANNPERLQPWFVDSCRKLYGPTMTVAVILLVLYLVT